MNCYCGENRNYFDCCFLLISGKKSADTPVKLMRSRYTAYSLKNTNYILRTEVFTDMDQAERRKIIEEKNKSVKWLGLSILEKEESSSKGRVLFVASYLANGCIKEHLENSLFERMNGKWFYVGQI